MGKQGRQQGGGNTSALLQNALPPPLVFLPVSHITTMRWLSGCAAIVTFCIMAGTATAATTAEAPTCANDICHIRAIRGSLQLMNVAFATCTEFDSNTKAQGDIKNGILKVAHGVECGFSGGVCTTSDVTLKCIGPITSS